MRTCPYVGISSLGREFCNFVICHGRISTTITEGSISHNK